MKKYRIQEGTFHRTAEELREFDKENDIKLLKLLEYLRKRKGKKIKARGPELKGEYLKSSKGFFKGGKDEKQNRNG